MKLRGRLTSGAIHGNVPASDIFVVLPTNLEAPKSQIYKKRHKQLLDCVCIFLNFVYMVKAASCLESQLCGVLVFENQEMHE